MISRIRGTVRTIGEIQVLLEVAGITYEVLVPPSILRVIQERPDPFAEVELVTFHYQQLEVGRGIPILIGFLNDIEREFFSRFISVSGVGPRAALKDVVDGGWSGTAAAESAAYRLVRGFRDAVFRRVISFVLAECYEADPSFDYTAVRRREAPIWQLAITQPAHLLDPAYETWDGLLLEAADEVIEQATRGAPGAAIHRPLAGHALVGTAGRPLHAARPLGRDRRIGTDGRVARQGGRRHPAHADRAERPPALAVLCELT